MTEDIKEDVIVDKLPPTGEGAEKLASEDLSPSPAPKKSLREELSENLKVAKEKQENPDKAPKPAQKKSDKSIVEAKPQSVPAPTPTPQKIPDGLPAEVKAEWATLSPKAQAALVKREEDVHKGMTKMDEERSLGRKIRDIATPYEAIIRSEGGTVDGAFKDLMNTAYILRTGTPQAKMNVFIQTARQFGVDLRNIHHAQPQQANPLDMVPQLVQKELQTFQEKQESEKIKGIIDAFAADTKHGHYEKVKPVMAGLLSSGAAQDMQDAYDKACFADPDIRSTLLAEKAKKDEADRQDQQKAKTDKARYAASSVRGSSPLNGIESPKPVKRSLRDELKANFAAATQH